MADGTQPVDSVARRYVVLRPHLDERQRRLFLGAEAREFGRGGIKVVAAATGVHPDTIARGVRELAGEAEPAVRVRAPGGGRKSLAESDPGLLLQLKAFVDPETRGDPMSLLVWTTKSTRNLADALTKPWHRVSDRTVARMLADLGFSLQGNTNVLRRRGRRSASLSSRTFRAPARRPYGYDNPHRRTPCCILTASPSDIVVE